MHQFIVSDTLTILGWMMIPESWSRLFGDVG